VWLTLPEHMDGEVLLGEALKQRVAFVGGRAFHCDGSGRNTLRLNFSYPSLADIELAVERLADCVGAMAVCQQPSRRSG
jgi:DNA-binding transcriptional MocR family regulator